MSKHAAGDLLRGLATGKAAVLNHAQMQILTNIPGQDMPRSHD